jgi:7-cyano-7-deazaguanine synthase
LQTTFWPTKQTRRDSSHGAHSYNGFDHEAPFTVIGNRRGEPTTEYVHRKTDEDVQPFMSPSGRWSFTHNGTIANDRDILRAADYADYRVDSLENGVLVDKDFQPSAPTFIDSYAIGVLLDKHGFEKTVRDHLLGSFAILAVETDEPQVLYYAANYKPLFFRTSRYGTGLQVASQRSYLDHSFNPLTDPGIQEIRPYSSGRFECAGSGEMRWINNGSLYPAFAGRKKVLVVCSGGLDSATVAWQYYKQGAEVCLLNIQYGAKAQWTERRAVVDLAFRMNCKSVFLTTDFFSKHASSVLTDPDAKVNKSNGGADGAEFAHEWVPARNTVMMALAMAYAEANDYHTIALGTNLEESGAYPDNEPEFLNKLQALVPYAMRAYHPLSIEAPVGNLMKREIVELGIQLGMPHELTWSCYEGGSVHCGECGPCYMRREAFRINGVTDPTVYQSALDAEAELR